MDARIDSEAAPVGVLPLAEIARRPGLDVLKDVVAGRLPRPPVSATMDFTLDEVAPGRAVFSGDPGQRFYNPYASVHGGYIATLLDSAMTCAVQTTLAAGQGVTTAEFKISFVKPVLAETGRVRAVGTVISGGRRLATAEGRLFDAAGTLFAHATTTCLIFEVEG